MSETPAVPAIPDYLKKYIASTPDAPSDTDSLVSTVSVPRISLKAKKFRFVLNGDEIKAEPEIHVVILGADPGQGKYVKTYYEGGYNPGDTSPPSCASSDGIRPDPWVTQAQNDMCATCLNNQFGSASSRTGKPAKACRDSKRLWVVQPEAIDGDVYALGVPVTSLKNLSEVGQKIKDTGLPMSAAVIKLTMEEDESFPIIKFAIAGWLGQEYGPKAIERNSKKDWTGALTKLNPPVLAHLGKSMQGMKSSAPQPPSQPQLGQQPAQQARPKVGDDGVIEGSSTVVQPKASPNVDEALKVWS